MKLLKYTEWEKNLSKYQGYSQYLYVAAVITDYCKYLEEENSKVTGKFYDGESVVLVGGLSCYYHTGGEYTTSDIDFVVENDLIFQQAMDDLGFIKGKGKIQGRYWVYEREKGIIFVETPGSNKRSISRVMSVDYEGYTLYVQWEYDIFIDRLRGYIGGEDSYLYQLDDLYKNNRDSFNWGTLKELVGSEKELKVLNKLYERYNNKSVELDYTYIKYKRVYVSSKDENIDEFRIDDEYVIGLEDCIVAKPKKGGTYVKLIGNYKGKEVIFMVKEEVYFSRNEGIGFTKEDVYSYGGKRIDKHVLNKYLSIECIKAIMGKTDEQLVNKYSFLSGNGKQEMFESIAIMNKANTKVSTNLIIKICKEFGISEVNNALRYGVIGVNGKTVFIGKKVILYDEEQDEILYKTVPSDVIRGNYSYLVNILKNRSER